MHSVRKPWWQQATALVTVTTGGVITGFNFVPGAAATMTSPTSVPLHLLALEQAGQPGAAMNARAVGGDSADSATGDSLLRSAIVNVAKYYLQLAATRSPAQMEALIWDNTSVNGADHGPSCAAFASLTLELAAQAVGQQSWVSGGSSYPWPLPVWADVRVDTNPASPAITSLTADAQAHDRWHQVDDGYQPQPGDWVVFPQHVEVVTRYAGGVLDTIGADSLPDLTVNAHTYGGALAADGVAGFVDNGHLAAAAPTAAGPGDAADKRSGAGSSAGSSSAEGKAATSSPAEGKSSTAAPTAAGQNAGPTAGPAGGQAVIPGIGQPDPVGTSATAGAGAGLGAGGSAAAVANRTTAGHAAPAAAIPGSGPMATAASGSAGIPGASPAAVGATAHPSTTPSSIGAPSTAAASASPVGTPTSASSPSTSTGTPSATATPISHASSTSTEPEQYRQYTAPAQATPGTRSQQAFISLIAPGAAAAQQRWGVPAAVTIAQAIEESAWGKSQLAADYHNLFGIKGSGPAGSVSFPTSEFYSGQWVTINAQFRVYHNVGESIADHAELLATSGYYQRAMADRAVPDAFANNLTGVYATDPDYGANLIAIMKLYNLYRFDGPAQSVQPQAASATPTPAASQSATASQPTAARPAVTHPTAAHPTADHAPAGRATAEGHAGGGQAAIPGLGSPALAPASGYAPAGSGTGHPSQSAAPIPGVVAPATTATRYQPQFTTAVTTAYFATAKGPLGHGEHLYRDVAKQTGIRWELLAACDWMQCKAHPRYSPVHGEKIGALNSDGTSYPTKSAALAQCASDLIELAGAVYGIDLTARRVLSVRALADAFAAFRWGALLRRHGVSAMEFPYSVAGLTAQHQKMHWPVIDDPAAPDRPGARFREPFGAVPVLLSLDYPATVLTDRKRRQPPCSGSFPGSAAGPTRAARPLLPSSRSPFSSRTGGSRAAGSSSSALTARGPTARTIRRS